MRTRRRTFVVHLEWNQFFLRSVFFGLQQNIATDEVRLAKVDKEPESGFNRISLRRKIGAVERVTHFQSQRIARAESAWFEPELFSFLVDEIPKLHCVGRAE